MSCDFAIAALMGTFMWRHIYTSLSEIILTRIWAGGFEACSCSGGCVNVDGVFCSGQDQGVVGLKLGAGSNLPNLF